MRQMSVTQAHIHLSGAQGSIRQFFSLENEEIRVICNLLGTAQEAETLKFAKAYTRLSGVLLMEVIGECDERAIVAKDIQDALAEFEYQNSALSKMEDD